jgi:hypothetical protein
MAGDNVFAGNSGRVAGDVGEGESEVGCCWGAALHYAQTTALGNLKMPGRTGLG